MVLTSGFTGTPVSRILILTLTTTSLLASMLDIKHLLPIKPTPHLWPYLQFSRILTFQLAYISSTELLFAVILLYQCRVVERLWGARRFASFVIVTWSVIAALVVGLGVTFKVLSWGWWGYLPPGVTGLVVALVVAWKEEVPRVYGFRVVIGNVLGRNSSGGATATTTTTTTNTNGDAASETQGHDEANGNLHFVDPSGSSGSSGSTSGTRQSNSAPGLVLSDKVTTYIVVSQLVLSQFPYQLLPTLAGWVVGVAWREELLPSSMMRWRVPAWVVGESGTTKERGRYEGLRRRLEEEGSGRDGMREVSDRVAAQGSTAESQTDDTQQRRGGITQRMMGYFTGP